MDQRIARLLLRFAALLMLIAGAPFAGGIDGTACLMAQFDEGNGGGGGGTSSGGTITRGGGSFYDYSEGGTLTMDVNVWGFVQSPGKYRVPISTKLIQIISYAGGPTDRARLSDVRVLHDMTVDSTLKEPVRIYNLEVFQETGDTNLNPILYPNDTVILPGDALNVFTEVLGVVRDVVLTVGTLVGLFVALKK